MNQQKLAVEKRMNTEKKCQINFGLLLLCANYKEHLALCFVKTLDVSNSIITQMYSIRKRLYESLHSLNIFATLSFLKVISIVGIKTFILWNIMEMSECLLPFCLVCICMCVYSLRLVCEYTLCVCDTEKESHWEPEKQTVRLSVKPVDPFVPDQSCN